jgi:hypothetical protein
MTRERRPARETLDMSIFDMAVLGGTALGGGGERLEAGLRLGRLAIELGDASLIDVESLPAHADLVAIATFSTSAGDETPYRLAHHKRAIQLLAANIETSIAGMVNCGSGAVDTMRAGQGKPVVSWRGARAILHAYAACYCCQQIRR